MLAGARTFDASLQKLITNQHTGSDVLSVCVTRITELDLSTAATAMRRLATIGVARGDLANDSTISQLTSIVAEKLHTAEPLAVSNTVWALAKLALRDEPLLSAISSASIPRLSQFGLQDLSTTAWALSAL
jgi:hypothetical protein